MCYGPEGHRCRGKILVCRVEALELYKPDLQNAFSRCHFPQDADMETYVALVFHPRIAESRVTWSLEITFMAVRAKASMLCRDALPGWRPPFRH
jgi:hypothetical protein